MPEQYSCTTIYQNTSVNSKSLNLILNSVLLSLSKTGETGTTGSKTGSRKQQKKIVDAAEKVKRGYFDKGMAKMRMLFG